MAVLNCATQLIYRHFVVGFWTLQKEILVPLPPISQQILQIRQLTCFANGKLGMGMELLLLQSTHYGYQVRGLKILGALVGI